MNIQLRDRPFDDDPVKGRYNSSSPYLFSLLLLAYLPLSLPLPSLNCCHPPLYIHIILLVHFGSWRALEGCSNVSAIAFCPRGVYFAVGHVDYTVSLWSYNTTMVLVAKLKGAEEEVVVEVNDSLKSKQKRGANLSFQKIVFSDKGITALK